MLIVHISLLYVFSKDFPYDLSLLCTLRNYSFLFSLFCGILLVFALVISNSLLHNAGRLPKAPFCLRR